MTELNDNEKHALALCLLETAIKRGEKTWPIIVAIAKKTDVIELVEDMAKEIIDLRKYIYN